MRTYEIVVYNTATARRTVEYRCENSAEALRYGRLLGTVVGCKCVEG